MSEALADRMDATPATGAPSALLGEGAKALREAEVLLMVATVGRGAGTPAAYDERVTSWLRAYGGES